MLVVSHLNTWLLRLDRVINNKLKILVFSRSTNIICYNNPLTGLNLLYLYNTGLIDIFIAIYIYPQTIYMYINGVGKSKQY
jgi:hypothetical protein